MNYILIGSVILFIMSIGSMNKHRAKNSDSMMENSINGNIILSLFTLLPFIMLVITVNKILDFKWYWNLIISFVISALTWDTLSSIYSSLFGYKSKPSMSLQAGGYVRHNIYIIDALITFGLGLIIYLIGR